MRGLKIDNITPKRILISQVVTAFLFLTLTMVNEVFDIPHYALGDMPTSAGQRFGEICIELAIFFIVIVIQVVVFKKMYGRIKILEGLLPICAHCKKIRTKDNKWEKIEVYISQHSQSQFSHGICPTCAKELYPEFYKKKAS